MRIVDASQPIPKRFSFRQAKKQDSEKIIKLVYQVLTEYDLVPEPQGVDSDLINVEVNYANGYFGIIEKDQKIVATYGLIPLNEKAVEIRKMYALPESRGHGLGKWMVSHLIEIARHNGYKLVELETASPLVEAIGLYKKMGFIEKNFENKTPRCDKSFYLNI